MNARLRFLVDEDFDNDIVRGLLRRLPTLDEVYAQDVGLSGQRPYLCSVRYAHESRHSKRAHSARCVVCPDIIWTDLEGRQ